MNKELIVGLEARKLITSVVIKLCDTVGMTLGPKGKNAIIDTDYSDPFVTNDGVTIAKNIEFNNKEEVIAKIIKEASIKTCDVVGDGTTTSLVLLKKIYLESLNFLNSGISTYLVKESLEKYQKVVINEINRRSMNPSIKEIESIARISSGSKEIGTLIKGAITSVGENGIIRLEESGKDSSYLEITNGIYVDSGVISSYMIKERKNSEELDDVNILITDEIIESINQISNILEKLKEKNLLIIAEEYSEDIINDLIRYKTSGYLNLVCIKSSNYSESKNDILEDICISTNATLISSKYGKYLNETSIKDLGKSPKIKVTNENTLIYKENSSKINERIKYLKEIISAEKDMFKKEIFEMRLSNLSKGMATIYAGGKTHAEMILNKMRIEDAICAAKSTIKHGYSLGGGMTYCKISNLLEPKEIGSIVLKNSLKEPLKTIIVNAGDDYNNIEKLLQGNENVGYNAMNSKIENLKDSGIIDSTESLIEALKNAISIVSVLLTTEIVIVNNIKKDETNITNVI